MEYGVDTVREKLQKLGYLDLAKAVGGAYATLAEAVAYVVKATYGTVRWLKQDGK